MTKQQAIKQLAQYVDNIEMIGKYQIAGIVKATGKRLVGDPRDLLEEFKEQHEYIFIAWDEETSDPEQVYVGGGYYDTIAVNKRLETKRARYAPYTAANLIKAQEYVANEIASGAVRDYQLNFRVIVLAE